MPVGLHYRLERVLLMWTRGYGEPVSVNPFDHDTGGFFVWVNDEEATPPVSDLRRCSSRLAGGLRQRGPRGGSVLHRTGLDRYTAGESAREAGSGLGL
jgi:hypothetical protein